MSNKLKFLQKKNFPLIQLKLYYIAMNLFPSTHLVSIEYNILDNLINAIQLHASSERYAITQLCTKTSYLTGLTKICYLCYDQGQKSVYLLNKNKNIAVFIPIIALFL